jgi:SPP1 gp7 family putative phage head morphogenesis protein
MGFSAAQRRALRGQLDRQKSRARQPEGVEASKGTTAQYYWDLKRLVKLIDRMVDTEILPVLKRLEPRYATNYVADDDPTSDFRRALDDLVQRFTFNLDKYAIEISTKMVTRENQYHRRQFINEIKKAIGVDISSIATDDGIDILLKERVAENVDLIKTIPPQYFERIEKTVLQGIQSGDDFFSIRKDLIKDFNITDNRARLIARDQVSKLNGSLNEFRQQDTGITHYTWRTSEDERVRDSHRDNDGKRFAWADPPSETGHPGNDIQCRCTADPDLSHFLALRA